MLQGGRHRGDGRERKSRNPRSQRAQRRLDADCCLLRLQGKTVEYANELRALQKLVTSPVYNRVYGPFLDAFTESGRQCIIQPYLGADLEMQMRKTGAFSVESVVDVLRQILEQLATAHRLKVVMNDVKLDNVVIANREEQQ